MNLTVDIQKGEQTGTGSLRRGFEQRSVHQAHLSGGGAKQRKNPSAMFNGLLVHPLVKMVKKRMDCSILLLIISLLLFLWTNTTAKEPDEIEPHLEKTWTVTEGESLWTIASMHSGESEMTIEQIVHWMMKKNELETGTIYPGQELLVPMQLEAFVQE
ncbi:LysM domain-containing protein [Evansella caseinilytica]|uniref:LysM domain-containing protein n=1 Tax=Evansella caseinilytica TaxID=1503961 RepID=A0A1H3LW44_9BACI|nr:LysM peptidoglycan-binding domain-containing protein [Evansella caseinilytica]SDY68249.1 LysM domain-containing protein [Evansella caseinilytica]